MTALAPSLCRECGLDLHSVKRVSMLLWVDPWGHEGCSANGLGAHQPVAAIITPSYSIVRKP